MMAERSCYSNRYPIDHWIRTADPKTALEITLKQQALAYSRVKNRFLFELLGEVSDSAVLDFGCGAGYLAVESAKRGASLVVGADAEFRLLAAARLHAAHHGVISKCLFVQADQLTFFSGSEAAPPAASHSGDHESMKRGIMFDAVILRDVLEHVPDDVGLLKSVARVLKPGGRLVIATQNAWSLNFVLEGAFRRYVMGQPGWMGWDPTHLRFFTPPVLSQRLRAAGLRVTGWRSAYLVPHKFPAPPGSSRQYWRLECLTLLDRVLGRVPPFDRLGWSLMVRAELRHSDSECPRDAARVSLLC